MGPHRGQAGYTRCQLRFKPGVGLRDSWAPTNTGWGPFVSEGPNDVGVVSDIGVVATDLGRVSTDFHILWIQREVPRPKNMRISARCAIQRVAHAAWDLEFWGPVAPNFGLEGAVNYMLAISPRHCPACTPSPYPEPKTAPPTLPPTPSTSCGDS